MEVSCEINEPKVIYPFAYRTHTHSLGMYIQENNVCFLLHFFLFIQTGKVVSGYRVRKNKYGIDNWTLLGKRDPMTPQMFYPVMNREPIYEGDVLVSKMIGKIILPLQILRYYAIVGSAMYHGKHARLGYTRWVNRI